MTDSAAPRKPAPLEPLEQIALLAAHVFDAPMAVLHCADGVTPPLRASVGLSAPDAERFQPLCAHCPEGGGAPTVVLNAAQHPVLARHPMVQGAPHIRFYACAPLVDAQGRAMGALVVMDTRERSADTDPLQALQALARLALAQIALHQQQLQLASLALERKSARRRLLEQAKTLRVAGRLAKVGGWSVALPGQQLQWSQDIANSYGLAHRIQTAQQALDLVKEPYRSALQQAFAACVQNGQPIDTEVPLQLAPACVLWLRIVGQSVRDPHNRALRVQGAFQDITQQRQADAALRLSEERFQLIAQATSDTLWDWDVRADRVWWGGNFQAMLGISLEQGFCTPEAFLRLLHPEDREHIAQSLRAAVTGTASHWRAEYRIQHSDGHYLWILDKGFVTRDSQGRPLRMVGGMANISARKEGELEVLREAHTHAELVHVQQRISSLDMPLPEVLQLVAHAAQEACGASGALVEMLEGDALVSQACAGQRVRPVGAALPLHDSLLWPDLQAGQPVLCNDIAAEGWELGDAYERTGVRAALAVPLRVDGAVVGALKVTSEHTGVFSQRDLAHLQILSESLGAMVQLRQVAARLRASEQQYRHLFDAHPQPIWVYVKDETLRFLAVNQAMQELYGYSEEQFLRMSMHDLWLPQDQQRLHNDVQAMSHEAPRNNVLYRHRNKSGEVMDIEVSSRGITFNGIAARQVMATNVTERLRAQRELARMARARHMLSSCNEILVRATSETALLQSVCRIVVDIGGYELGWVGFARDDAHKTIEIVAHAGDHADYLQTLELSWSDDTPQGRGPAGTTVRSGQPVIVRDVHTDPTFADVAERLHGHGFHGVISLPLSTAQHTFGLLYLYAPEVLHIGPEETALLQELANDLAFGIMSLRARKEQQRLQASVLKMAAAVSAATGTEFFVQLARNMSEALGAQVGCVGRLLPCQEGEKQRLMTLALVINDTLVPNIEYAMEHTPSAALLSRRQHVVTHDLAAQYPLSPIVGQLQAQGYAGQQLCDSAGKPTGIIFVLFHQRLTDADFVASTLQIFAARASAEIERQEADAHIRHQASLLDKAQDAIVVRDLHGRVTFWNKSAERLYGRPRDEALGQPIETLLYRDPGDFHMATGAVLDKGEWAGEIVQYDQGGQAIDMEGRWTLVPGHDNEPGSILEINTDIRQRKATDREIQRLAFYDTLTGLPNRMLLLDRMQQALGNAQRHHQGGALLFIDLDNFKTLNDTLGHDKGDLLLQQVAQRLNGCVRSVDTVARLGGDEFVVMLEGLDTDPESLALEARRVGEKVLAALSVPYALAGYQYRSTPSIGVAPFLGTQTSVLELLKQADLAMYQAKTAGRSTLRFYNPQMQAVVTARAALEADLRAALAHNQFVLHFQPQVDHTSRYVGVEALVRWQHPGRGLVSPLDFIALAEETGLILTLGRWVLHSACKVLAQWQKDPQLRHLTMAVNVSSRQFRNNRFVDDVARALAFNEAPAHLLKLELTESLLVEDMDDAIATMTALRQLGVLFALDDFGTGYSSLSYLKRMPLHQLKIDQSFVRDLLTDPNDAAIVQTIIALSRSLGLEVMAEGVETPEQHALLLKMGCMAFQGYLFSKPTAVGTLEWLLRAPRL
jgi:diguanylate cyclase (GGDEF)-like protein/PAS domain S-box-containing protein